MGAKTSMLFYAAGDARAVLKSTPRNDADTALQLVRRLYSNENLVRIEDGDLLESSNPDNGYVYVGSFPGLSILSSSDFSLDNPSRIDRRFIDVAEGRTVYLHAMHSVVDWFAYAVWEKRKLVRSLSLSPDSGILESIGKPLTFETPYWNGEHPVEMESGQPPYPLPFHPLELGEQALRSLFGFVYEGPIERGGPLLEHIKMSGFRATGKTWLDNVLGWFGKAEG